MTRDQQMNFRASKVEKAAYQAAAEASGMKQGEWMRAVLGAASGDESLRKLSRLNAAVKRAEREAARLAK